MLYLGKILFQKEHKIDMDVNGECSLLTDPEFLS